MTASSESLAEEIATLQSEVKALDKAVAEATEQRKEEHGEYLTLQQENSAAVQLIEKAKNRLFKFYRPNLHKEAPAKELTDEEKLLAAAAAGHVGRVPEEGRQEQRRDRADGDAREGARGWHHGVQARGGDGAEGLRAAHDGVAEDACAERGEHHGRRGREGGLGHED